MTPCGGSLRLVPSDDGEVFLVCSCDWRRSLDYEPSVGKVVLAAGYHQTGEHADDRRMPV